MTDRSAETTPLPTPSRSFNNGKVYQTTLSNGYPAKLSKPCETVVQLSYDVIVEDRVTPVEAKAVLITPEQEETMLYKNASNGDIAHDNGMSKHIKILWDRNNLPMKDEDRSSVDSFKRDSMWTKTKAEENGAVEFWRNWHSGVFNVAEGQGSDLLASVFDGFQGFYAAELINRVLHASLSYALRQGPKRRTLDQTAKIFEDVFGAIGDIQSKAAISHLDPGLEPKYDFLPPGLSKMISPGALWSGQTGTVVVTAFIDLEAEMLYIANLGDCRAVAGWYRHNDKMWECDVLSEDQTPENPSEAKRLIQAHPETPSEILIKDRGFAHGTFGFGSHTCSFAGAMQTIKENDLDPAAEAIGKPVPKWYREKGARCQPYVSSIPSVVSRDLGSGGIVRKLKFVILATDGIWDRLTSEEAVLLVAAHLEKYNGSVSKADLPKKVSLLPPAHDEERPYPAQPLPGTAGRDKGAWIFKDTNASTHLIRNAIGDGDGELRRMVLSLSGPEARELRDDMTATVLFF